ncbi:MAG TPA: recombinase XerD, partial [Phycisphaerae bacterium]|nr:recombinase XerD [Phycisphaerae bacterium]HRY69899.1 recombinase XerD [Phycisphaerae bacterium]HSA27107.1 recombinase XerD [Phycisphaerae bacterium]
MPALVRQHPSYRLHKPSGQAVLTLDGEDHYLGKYGTAESRAEYDRLLALWLVNGRRLPQPGGSSPDLTVDELIVAYWEFARRYYVKNGRPTDEQAGIRLAFRPLAKLFGATQASEFSPLRLKTVRSAMIAKGWCRSNVNKNVGRIKRLFGWGVENELVPPAVIHGLRAVKGLAKGRSEYHGAADRPPVRPIAEDRVNAIRPYTSPQVWAMIQVQLLTGCRPGEVVEMRGCDLDASGNVAVQAEGRHQRCIQTAGL